MWDGHERFLTPSEWTTRMPASEVVGDFVRRTTEDSARARREFLGSGPGPGLDAGMRYGPREANSVDVFGTGLPADSPILVFFSGGYWQVRIKGGI